jgi:tRNA(adenine34) deaminase
MDMPYSDDDKRFMRLAIEQANEGDKKPGAGEVGCVIVKDSTVVAQGHNEVELRHDPTAHAEIVTIRLACERLNASDLRDCTLYCTLQPCGMCTVACIWAKITRIVYGATRNEVHSMYFDTKHINTADLIADAFRDDITIEAGLLSEECAAFYYSPEDHPPPEKQLNK